MYFKLYHKYLGKVFIKITLEITAIFFALIFIMNFLEEINFFKDIEVNALFPIFLTLLNIPSILYDIFPFIFLISTQFFFLKITDRSELALFKTNGINNIKILSFIIFISFIISLIINLLFYNFSSNLKHQYLTLKNEYSLDNKYLAVINNNGLWIKDEFKDSIYIINSPKLEKNLILDAEIIEFDKNFKLIRRIFSKSVNIEKSIWKISSPIISKDNKEILIDYDISIETNLSAKELNSYFSNLKSLSYFELIDTKNNYKKLGYSTVDIEIHLQKYYTYPFYLTIMSLFACIIMLNIRHNRPKIFHIILGIMISVIIYYINIFSNILGQSLEISNKISTLLPIILISLVCCIGLLTVNEK